MKHLDFVREYDNVILPLFCDRLIQVFEESESKVIVNNEYKPFFTELNLNQHSPDIVEHLVYLILSATHKYKNDVQQTGFFPKRLGLEELRVKRYNAGTGERFDEHVDVASLDGAKRYLAFICYLNDDFTGGETTFGDKTITPSKGKVVVFPPTWQYPHAGLPVDTGTKYIMSTYLNYLPDDK